jgi:hypothetical protein
MENKELMIKPNGGLQITSIDEALKLANHLCKSQLVPLNLRGKPEDVLVAILMGKELGISPIQAIQNIAVINGKACIYGDLMLALVLGSGKLDYIKENTTEEIQKQGFAICEVKRKDMTQPMGRRFSIDDARKAGLTNKAGTWQQYPERMIQMRARAWALRDGFADILRGIMMREEVEDYNVEVVNTSTAHNVVKQDIPIAVDVQAELEPKPETKPEPQLKPTQINRQVPGEDPGPKPTQESKPDEKKELDELQKKVAEKQKEFEKEKKKDLSNCKLIKNVSFPLDMSIEKKEKKEGGICWLIKVKISQKKILDLWLFDTKVYDEINQMKKNFDIYYKEEKGKNGKWYNELVAISETLPF